MILDKVLRVDVHLRGLHLADIAKDLSAKLGILERQGLDSLDNDEVGSGSLSLVEAHNLVLLVHHLVLLVQLVEVTNTCVIVACSWSRVHADAADTPESGWWLIRKIQRHRVHAHHL